MLKYQFFNLFFGLLLAVLLVSNCWFLVPLWVYLVVFLVRFGVLLLGSSFIELNYHVQAFCKNKVSNQKVIALTFDDGPSAITPQILEVLKKHQAQATFFCIGKNIDTQPHIVKEIVAQGHSIGNHSYSHGHFFDFYSKKKIIQEIKDTDAAIKKHTGLETTIFRPPYGVTNPAIRKALAVTQHQVIGWNIRSMDGISSNEEKIFLRIKKRLQPGSILLLHDTSMSSLRVLEQLLLFLNQENYKVLPLDALMNLKF